MHLIRTVAPAVLPVTLAEVKAGANLDGGSDDDAKIAGPHPHGGRDDRRT